MTRREFVHASGAVALASLNAPSVSASPDPKTKIPLGFLGAAHPHAVGKWKILRENPAFDLIGICDSSPEVRATFKDLNASFISEPELLERAEALVVDSAVRNHARDARTALTANKHIHLEKPPSATLDEFAALVELAKSKSRVMQVGYQWRYHQGFEKIFEAVRQGWLGKVFLVQATMNIDLAPEKRAEWAEFKGGGMFELGSHMIDPLIRLMGKPSNVTSHLRHDSAISDSLKDNNVVVFDFPAAIGVVCNGTTQPNFFQHRVFQVCGSNGTMTLKPVEPPTLEADLSHAAGPYAPGKQIVSLPPYTRYEDDFRDFADAIRGQKPLAVTFEEDLILHEWLLRACAMI